MAEFGLKCNGGTIRQPPTSHTGLKTLPAACPPQLCARLRKSKMPDWPNHLTDTERAQLAKLDARLAADTAERRRLMNLAKQRKHRATR